MRKASTKLLLTGLLSFASLPAFAAAAKFTLYTMGDVEIFRAALVAVSMAFTTGAAGFGGGGGSLGFGPLVGFGLLVALVMMLFSGIMKQRMEIGEFIVLIIAFFVLFVPTVDMQIEDYSGTNEIATVDEVPLGIAFPAAAMSALTRQMNDVMSTAFTTVNGTSFTNIQSPLRLLNGLRKAAVGTSASADPALSASLKAYSMYCLAGMNGFDLAKWNSTKLKDFSTNLLGFSTQGLTLDYLPSSAPGGGTIPGDPMGVLISCSAMNGKLSAAIDAFYSDGDFAKILNSASVIKAAGSSGTGTTNISPMDNADYEAAFTSITGATVSTAKEFALMTLFSPQVNGAIHCAVNVANNRDLAQCTAFASATNQWAEDSAAAGSFFQRLMTGGMNSLLFLFFCLSPVVAIVMLMTGARGFKIAGSYLLFGAWAQSWFIGALIINFYIQKQIDYEIRMLGTGGIDNLTSGTMGAFYDSLQLKIGLAGDMLTSVPLLMMAIISGSAYSLSSVASRWSGKEHYDEKVNSPSLVGGAPIHSNQSQYTQQFGSATAVDQSIGSGSAIDLGHTFKADQSAAVQAQNSASLGLSSAMNEAYKRDISTSEGRGRLRQLADGIDAAGAHDQAAQLRRSLDAYGGTGSSSSQGDGSQTSQGADLGAGLPGGKGGPGGGGGGIPIKAGATVDLKRSWSFDTRDTADGGTKGGLTAADHEGDTAKSGRLLSWQKMDSLNDQYQKVYGKSVTLQDGKTWSENKAQMESASRTTSLSEIFGGKRTISAEQLTTMIDRHGSWQELNTGYNTFSGKDGVNGEVYRDAFKRAGIEYEGIDTTARREMQQYRALEAVATRGTGADRDEADRQLRNFAVKTYGGGDLASTRHVNELSADGNTDIRTRAHAAVGSAEGVEQLKRNEVTSLSGRGAGLGSNVPTSKERAQPVIKTRYESDVAAAEARMAGDVEKTVKAGDAERKTAANLDPRSNDNDDAQQFPGPIGDAAHWVTDKLRGR